MGTKHGFAWVVAAALTLAGQGAGQAAAAAPAPKLIVTISVDQFSADLFAQYRQTWTAGMKRLTGGAVFPSGFQSHAATETCPGHSTILTGDRPARTGIIANNWYDLGATRPDKQIYCAEDESVAGTDSSHYSPSPTHLRVPTLGDRMKQANPATRVVSVAGKDRAAIMMGGHDTDQIWFWQDDHFRTLDDHRAPAPAAVATANARATAALAREDPNRAPAQCAALATPVPVGQRTLGLTQPRKAGDRASFRATPAFDAAVTDLAIGLLNEMKLGKGPGTDLLIVGLSATDYTGHGFGTEGVEMCAQMAGLDANVGRLLAALDASGVPYAVALTADHGGHDLPERNAARAVPDAVRVDPALMPAAVDKAIRAEFGLDTQVIHGDSPAGDLYVDRRVPAALRPRVIAAIKARYLASPQVEAVFTADELGRPETPERPVDDWSLIDRARASFDPARSGDLLVLLKPHVVPLPNPNGATVATHGSIWNYDRRVPIVFWWPGMIGFEQPVPVETVDIMPSLAALIGVKLAPGAVDGRCLDLDAGAASTCPALK